MTENSSYYFCRKVPSLGWFSDLKMAHCWRKASLLRTFSKSIICRNYASGHTTNLEKLGWEGCSRTALLGRLENALKDHQVVEAWDAYKDFKRVYGFPEYPISKLLITELSYSLDNKWLVRAYDIVLSMSKDKSVLSRIELDVLTKLCLSLARAQMPVQSSVVLRLIIRKKNLPPVDILGLGFLHMVKTQTGALLSANILVEICDLYQDLVASKSNCARIVKPDTAIFNLILDGCVRFGSSLKGQQLVELMARVGVIADAHSIIIISRIHEMSKMRDELKRFKKHIDIVSSPSLYRQFYDILLSLHFSFNDIDSASSLIADIYGFEDRIPKPESGSSEPLSVPIGSANLKLGLKLKILPELQLNGMVFKVEGKPTFVQNKDGKLSLTSKALATLIREHRRSGKVNELSKLLIRIQSKPGCSESADISRDVVEACIRLGWLETAHDILDDLEGTPIDKGLYLSLLSAYYERKMFKEGDSLRKQIKTSGLSEETLVSQKTSALVESIIHEINEDGKTAPPSSTIHELNSSIYYFAKTGMMGDALRTYRRMLGTKIAPSVHTFAYLIDGFASAGMLREITILWGDMKRCGLEKGGSMAHRDVFEALLSSFIRGGYFERVMEVVGLMVEKGMFTDKLVYKNEFYKFHRDLYRNKKADGMRNEVQMKRLEHVQAFKNWVMAN